MNILNISLIVLGAIILILVIWYIAMINKLRRSIVKIDEAASGIDVALNKRYDVLTKMLDVTKNYAKHEVETFSQVVNLRNEMSMNEKLKANEKMNKMIDGINIVAENYPELKSSENYKQLQISISDVEEHLQASRRMYNGNVSIYNQQIVSFPISVVANMNKLKSKEFFEVEDEKKKDVKMKF